MRYEHWETGYGFKLWRWELVVFHRAYRGYQWRCNRAAGDGCLALETPWFLFFF